MSLTDKAQVKLSSIQVRGDRFVLIPFNLIKYKLIIIGLIAAQKELDLRENVEKSCIVGGEEKCFL